MATNATHLNAHGHLTNAANHNNNIPGHFVTQRRSPFEVHNTTQDGNHPLLELVQAAATAAGEVEMADMVLESTAARKENNTPVNGKRKRLSSSPPAKGARSMSQEQTAKRVRVYVSPDAQPAGTIHSAAALFRAPSTQAPRKYTRPPMSKLFMSLQLSPENFIHLQARAKAYMLDPLHPERQTCVGSRGKGDTDMVKLRLFNCVRDFLNEGAGEQFFGEHVEKKDAMDAARALGEDGASEEEKLIWPRDGNKIISLVTPLLRRMVTNERQRMYAIETRKGGKKKEGSVEANDSSDAGRRKSPYLAHVRSRKEQTSVSATSKSSLDRIHLEASRRSPQPARTTLSSPFRGMDEQDIEMSAVQTSKLPTERRCELRKIHIFLAKDGIRLKQQKHIIGPDPLLDYSWEQLLQHVSNQVKLALATYPALRPAHLRSSNADQIAEQLKGMNPDTLQGLAVAGNDTQSCEGRADKPVDAELRVDSVAHDGANDAEPSHTSVSYPKLPALNTLTTFTDTLASSFPPANRRPSIQSGDDSLARSDFDTASPRASTRALAPNSQTPSPSLSEPSLSPTRSADHQDSETEVSPSTVAPPPVALPPPVVAPEAAAHAASKSVSSSPTSGDSRADLPRYMVKVMLTTGLTLIRDTRDWEDAKRDVGCSVWANGRLSVVVEVV